MYKDNGGDGYPVLVLMSTYNGEKYLREQLDSVLAQEGCAVRLLVRDDGSTDATREILEGYRGRYKNIQVVYGENIGVAGSFFELVGRAGDVPYAAFSDQDDVWLPTKLSRAIRMIRQAEGGGRPVVYCSATRPVDERLRPLRQAVRYKEVRPGFGNALVENICTGCTCVVNHAMLQLLQGKKPGFAIMHDFWAYLVGSCFGRVIYDPEARILYRQHGGNVLGMATGRLENYKRRVLGFRAHRGLMTRQAMEFLRAYPGQLPGHCRGLAEDFVRSRHQLAPRARLALQKKIYRQRKSDDLVLRILLLLGLV